MNGRLTRGRRIKRAIPGPVFSAAGPEERNQYNASCLVAPVELLPRHADEGTIEISRVRAVVCMYAARDKISVPYAGSSFSGGGRGGIATIVETRPRDTYVLFFAFQGRFIA